MSHNQWNQSNKRNMWSSENMWEKKNQIALTCFIFFSLYIYKRNEKNNLLFLYSQTKRTWQQSATELRKIVNEMENGKSNTVPSATVPTILNRLVPNIYEYHRQGTVRYSSYSMTVAKCDIPSKHDLMRRRLHKTHPAHDSYQYCTHSNCIQLRYGLQYIYFIKAIFENIAKRSKAIIWTFHRGNQLIAYTIVCQSYWRRKIKVVVFCNQQIKILKMC